MSKITSAHAAIISIIAATLTNARRLPDAHDIAANNGLYLTNGYALAIGPGSKRTPQELSCSLALEREFAIVLTRLVASLEHDAGGQSDTALALMEDQLLITKAFDQNGSLTSLIADFSFVADSGIESVNAKDDAGRFYVLTSVFRGTYQEALNT